MGGQRETMPYSDIPISSEYTFGSHYVEILGSRMHYIMEGTGDPMLFLHGNPTFSSLWRNIIPHLSPIAQCVAPDLIGMGRSDKPNIEYLFVDHARYLEAFIDRLNLKNITLVVHDWGSALGFSYAMRNPSNIKGIVFMESITRPASWRDFSILNRFFFRRLRDPIKGRKMVLEKNMLIEKLLPMMTSRKLTSEEMEFYRSPYKNEEDRKPLMMWPQEIPIDGDPADTYQIIRDYSEKLRKSKIPKLLLWARPGVIIKRRDVKALRGSMNNLEDRCLGKGKHFVQEEHPHAIGQHIREWYTGLTSDLT